MYAVRQVVRRTDEVRLVERRRNGQAECPAASKEKSSTMIPTQ